MNRAVHSNPKTAPRQAAPFAAKAFLAGLPAAPGVYLFYGKDRQLLYVGKAANLKKRLPSYFRASNQSPKTRLMMSRLLDAEIQRTASEAEALLLENNLVKHRRPRYNIALRDDKSYPYLRLSAHPAFPRFTMYRGKRRGDDDYFGPYASAAAVREMLSQIHKIFRLRQCTDAFFRNRTRPCLQHQIGRCSAPCVGLIDAPSYQADVEQARQFLLGRNDQLITRLREAMEQAAQALEYERAAGLRDRLGLLRRLQERQYIEAGRGDADVVGVAGRAGLACFCLTTIRQGRNLGSRFHIQDNPLDLPAPQLLAAFLPQYYLDQPDLPGEILLGERVAGLGSLAAMLTRRRGGRVALRTALRSHRRHRVEDATRAAADHLEQHLGSRGQIGERLTALTTLLDLKTEPARIECFDISHTGGERAVGGCVVFDPQGAVRAEYRRYNIKAITPGDDYAALRQALSRRYRRRTDEGAPLPDLLLIDGGPGQLRCARETLDELNLSEQMHLVAVSKGPARRVGAERLHRTGHRPLTPGPQHPALHLIQQIRDEAHRFALLGHRLRRARARTESPLERIEGIGPARRRSLLRHFGGLAEVKRAAVEDLARAPGISRELAARIFDELR